ncbi:DUF6629 family protein [Nitrosomonas sp. Nm58]|uniref:DUF6629 family protein n=1 Tax=Nitrosomonas sp. Nm58 TaxID=200126 RepID=UPI0008994AEC|nr:DUF6629 family protein [Nitrosomonas sp. Nm58]SDY36051.1 hypothetical protein SAMN05421754_100785 [Nitrosomonas sp. Nm58]
MCFSAEASFIASGVLVAVGVSAVRKVRDRKDIFIAFIPLIFALQQLAEGVLWIVLEHGEMPQGQLWLANLYGIFIGVIWPFYAPFAIHQGETDNRARKVMISMIVVGLGLAAYTIAGLINEPIMVYIVNNNMRYVHEVEGQQFVLVMYLFATCVPFILSSDRGLNITGIVISLGFFVAFYAYRETFASIWCFFAAVASALIYVYIDNQNKKYAMSGVTQS